ncbi:uncharacterized protein K444DRAFT_406644 [Hyaloscypha bicolor E]|uniref:Uncharacterized protein n=1 Tax=Hyaloscypha bicolor E TaxID=1095630 RepID=A0A2J6T9A7_9HELO|nr:uncharacterized protein K444DRAFT_406644 [Hyaloscypha bicolor E]PMD59607.1 hypothetical protein K444DRAFT_406644 [Hyaloscypha bicolor E]
MPPTRHSKRVQGKSPDQILSSGRARKPPKSSLAAFDASRPPPTTSNRGTGRRKAKRRPGALSPISLALAPEQIARGLTVDLNSIPLQVTSPVTASLTATPSKKGKNQAIIPPFDPTSY